MSCPDENTIAELVDGCLDEGTRAVLDDHIDACARCRGIVGMLAGARGSGSLFHTRSSHKRTLHQGDTVGRFVILEQIGAGSMGIVYAAYDPTLDRKIALKLWRTSGDRENAQQRLHREAKSMARLSHPNIVGIYELGLDGDQIFIAMEYVAGSTLRAWLADAARSLDEILEVFIAAGRGLAAAHAAAVVHRDFKPDNVLVSGDGRVRVTDFGLAALDRERSQTLSVASVEGSTLDLSRTGMQIGTPRYMAPEQHRGAQSDARSDQFSFCVALFEAIHGKPPFEGDDWQTLLRSIESGQIAEVPAHGVAIPGAVQRALRRGLAAAPSERHPDLETLLQTLEQARRSPRRRRLAVTATFGLVGVPLAAMMATSEDRSCEGVEIELTAWSDATRRKVQGALVTHEPASATLLDRLDDYALQWAQTRRAICTPPGEALGLEHRLSAERCLIGSKRSFEALVQMLADGRFSTPALVLESLAELPPVRHCTDPAALEWIETPLRPRIAELLSRAEALSHAGAYEDAIAEAQAAIEDAEQHENPREIAAASLRVALTRAAQARPSEAESVLHDVLIQSERAHDDRLRAEAMVLLMFVVGYAQGRHDEGERWGEWVEALADRQRLPPLLLARRDRYHGLLAYARGHYEESARWHEQTLQRLEAAGLRGHPQYVLTLADSGNSLRALGDRAGAEARYETAIDHASEVIGPNNPRVGNMLQGLADVHYTAGELEEAEQAYRRALAIHSAAFPPEHPTIAAERLGLGTVAVDREEWELAQRELLAAIAIYEKTAPVGVAQHALALEALAHVRVGQSRLDEALALMLEAKAKREDRAPNHPDIAASLYNLGLVRSHRHEWREAIENFEEALERARGYGPEFAGLVHSGLATAHAALGEYATSEHHLGEAIRLLEPFPGRLSLALHTLLRVAERRYRLGARSEAVANVRTVLAALSELPDLDPELRELAETWLREHGDPEARATAESGDLNPTG